MKCVQNINSELIKRVSDDVAKSLVEDSNSTWKYIGKEKWKKEMRDPAKSLVKSEVVAPTDATTEQDRLRKIESRKQKKEYQKQRRERTGN